MREPGCDGTARVAERDRILSDFAGAFTSVFTSVLGPALGRFCRNARGATSIEYALIAGLVFLAVVGSLRTYAARVNGVYNQITTAVTQNN